MFLVRGSSKKEKIDFNQDLICYILHGTSLRVWRDDADDTLEYVLDNKDAEVKDIAI